jgi:hypothetical protein
LTPVLCYLLSSFPSSAVCRDVEASGSACGHEAPLNLKAEGNILAGGFPVGERAIAFIVEADFPEELDSFLQGIPFWGIVKTKVTLLQDFEDRRDQDRQFTKQLEQTLQR